MNFSNIKMLAGAFSIAFFLMSFSTHIGKASSSEIFTTCTCAAPTNGTITNQTSNSISFSWDSMTGATAYKVYYIRDGVFTSATSTVTNTSILYNGLQSGNYVFYISTVCGLDASSFIILEDVLME